MTDAKQYLRQLTRKDKRINALMERREHYQSMACRGTSSYTAERVSGTGQRSRVEDYAIKLIDLDKEVGREICRYVDLTREIEGMIKQLPDDRHRDILAWRYINGWDWDRIAGAMRYDLRWVFRLHGEALSEFTRILHYYTQTTE